MYLLGAVVQAAVFGVAVLGGLDFRLHNECLKAPLRQKVFQTRGVIY
jgi:hypothetical protein